MELDSAHLERNRPQPSALSWQTLSATCGTVLSLSREISSRLQQGAQTQELVPLLRQEAELTRQLRDDIFQLGQLSLPSSPGGNSRSQVVSQMEELLSQERENHQLLSSRGVKINGTRPYRYRPQKT
ncbi:MAG: hypothetical protein HOC74_33275 [Gemmatimonadetes bacterium]|jgi:hypothetical protein|nr:hypothetical protein [Gemmatimonadota bacterium]